MLRGHAIKVVFVECHDLDCVVDGRVIGGVLELIACNTVTVRFRELVPVVQGAYFRVFP